MILRSAEQYEGLRNLTSGTVDEDSQTGGLVKCIVLTLQWVDKHGNDEDETSSMEIGRSSHLLPEVVDYIFWYTHSHVISIISHPMLSL